MQDVGIRLELSFAPNAELVGSVRRFVSDFFARTLGNVGVSDGLAMAAHELLDNAVKYSQSSATPVTIAILQSHPGAPISIMTRNSARPENLQRLAAIITAMQAAGDAMAFYQTLLRKSAREKEGSGLGLARIWAEADMALSFAGDENSAILTAVTSAVVEIPHLV